MGCDGHSAYQVRGADGKWTTVAVDLIKDRWYSLFSLLVGYDHPRATFMEPLIPPRGLPPDLEHRVQGDFKTVFVPFEGKEYKLGWHNHSWYTLAELKDKSAKRRRVASALLTPEDLADWDGQCDPRHVYELEAKEDHDGQDSTVLSRDEYEVKTKLGLSLRDENVLVRVWFEAEPNVSGFIADMEKLIVDEDETSVRMLIGLDS